MYDPYQVVERLMFNIPCKLKEYCQKKPHGTKREIVRITKENYASQIINFRIPLFVRNGELKVKDVSAFLTKMEGELYDNMFSSINAGEYDMLLDNTSDFMVMYDNKSQKILRKQTRIVHLQTQSVSIEGTLMKELIIFAKFILTIHQTQIVILHVWNLLGQLVKQILRPVLTHGHTYLTMKL